MNGKLLLASMLCWFSLALPNCVRAAEPAHDVIEGNAQYEKGNYDEAAKHYKLALDRGVVNGDVHYNLANAYYRSKEFGKAIAHYREAERLEPGDADISANLSLARKQVVDRIEDSTSLGSQLERLLFIRGWFSAYQLQVGFLVLYSLFWAAFLLEPLNLFGMGRTASGVMLGVVLFAALIAFGTRLDRTGKPALAVTPAGRSLAPAVITKSEVKVYSGNSEQFQVVFVLHSGAEVESAERRGDWIQIVLPPQQAVTNGKAAADGQLSAVERRGWIKASDCYVLS